MAQYSTIVQKSFAKGVSASAGRFEQPRGSCPRLSNFILSRRGALKTCDGTQIVSAYTGVPTSGRGRIISSVLFQPIGVLPYYLLLQELLDEPLGAPRGLVAALVSGGTLTVAQAYFYQVTALDNIGGETLASNEVTATPVGGTKKIKLTWQTVPNAVQYNV